ncbi:plasma membrane-associated cation-binding protein 1-like isoform X2 [Musa acuminata AAA Group]|uniref:plasma membrane-associated cation-binding protein 1-like isoform X2 n=1 Tax=Musa acuminata AAA Group TaxID=214697 RepID=UPI0031DD8DB6
MFFFYIVPARLHGSPLTLQLLNTVSGGHQRRRKRQKREPRRFKSNQVIERKEKNTDGRRLEIQGSSEDSKVFGGGSSKKVAAAEVVKSFDESKEEISKESKEKKSELRPKVTEIYEASPAQIKALVKNPTESDLKRNSAAIKKFLEELVKIEFRGSKPVSEAAAKYGPADVSGPITFMFEKEEAEKVEENPAPPLPATDTPAPTEPASVPAPAQEPAKD